MNLYNILLLLVLQLATLYPSMYNMRGLLSGRNTKKTIHVREQVWKSGFRNYFIS